MTELFDEMPTEVEMALAKVEAGGSAFRPQFKKWLEKNFHIWRRFMLEADKIKGTGRSHYSARTIGEFIRHQTALKEADSAVKVSDHVWPDCARLYAALRPECEGFFEFRNTAVRQ